MGSAAAFQSFGRMGVDIFFVISGFVICRGLVREREKFGRLSLAGFYIRRVFRILPPLVTYCAVVVTFARLGLIDRHADGVARGLVFACNVPGTDCGGIFGAQLWSLSTEEQFYLVMPLLLIALPRRALGLVLMIVPLFALMLYAVHLKLAATFVQFFIPIAWGVALALGEAPMRRAIVRAPGWSGIAALAVLVGLYAAQPARLATAAQIMWEGPVIAYLLLFTMVKAGKLQGVLTYRPVVAYGRASYGIYLWQQLAIFSFPGRMVLRNLEPALCGRVHGGFPVDRAAVDRHGPRARFFSPAHARWRG